MKVMKRWVLQPILIVNLRYYHILPSLKHFGFKVAKLKFDNEHWIFLTCYSIGDSYRIDPYYLINSILLFWLTIRTDSRNYCIAKIDKRKKQIHPAHNPRFNHDLQLEMDCIEWALKKIEVNKIPNDRLQGVILSTTRDLEKRKDKAMERSDADDFWIKDRKSSMGSIFYLCYKE